MKIKNDFLSKSYFYLTFIMAFISVVAFGQHGLQVEQGPQNTLAGGGMAVIGASNSYRLKLDNNGIQAGNGVNAATLYQNYWGGSINMLGAGNTTGNLFVDGPGLTYINSSNRIGIGTYTPSAKLHVVGDQMRLSDPIVSSKYVALRTDGAGLDLSAFGGALYLSADGGSDVVINNGSLLRANHGLRVNGNTDGLAWSFGVNGQSIFREWVSIVSGNTTNTAIQAIKDYPTGTFVDRYGVYGENDVDPNYGYGVFGRGGWKGVYGISTNAGAGSRTGVQGVAGNSTGGNYGVYGSASGSSGTRYAGYFSGNVNVTGTFTNPSDRLFKTDVKLATETLIKVNQLVVKSYKHKAEYVEKMKMSEKEQFGFIAQEFQEVFPELVSNNLHPLEDSKDEFIEYLGVNYIGLVPILTKSIQELSAENGELKTRLAKLEELVMNMSK